MGLDCSYISSFLRSTKLGKRSRLERSSSLLHNVTEQSVDRFSVTDEKTHDSTLFETGSWFDGRLVLFDLAYFK